MRDETADPTRAPWTAEQVENLNRFQRVGAFHPFTCGTPECREVLVATPEGWKCPKCPYRQDWAHPSMLDGIAADAGEKMAKWFQEFLEGNVDDSPAGDDTHERVSAMHETLKSAVRGDWTAEQLPFDKEKSPACLSLWLLRMPGAHPFWGRFILGGIYLREVDGFPPAKKRFPEATHEVLVGAVDPSKSDDDIKAGNLGLLDPLNHVVHLQATGDEKFVEVCRALVQELLDGKQIVEPSGIRGARDLFRRRAERLAAE